MNIVIIEDEEIAVKQLKNILSKIDYNFNIINIIDSIEKSVEWFKNNAHPDLIFLDIELSDGLSFNIFNQVEILCPVIFTTAYNEYAIKAFEINSIDYLLKPITVEKLDASIKKYQKITENAANKNNNFDLSKIITEISQNKKSYKSRFLINKTDSLFFVNSNDIAYFYSEQKATFIITKDNKKHILNDSLDSISINLDPKIFFRINRQFIISINSILKIHNYFNYKLKLELTPSYIVEDVIVSRTKVNEFKAWLSE